VMRNGALGLGRVFGHTAHLSKTVWKRDIVVARVFSPALRFACSTALFAEGESG
jgi:hypothetical protein